MADPIKNSSISLKEFTLSPFIRLAKIIGTGLSIALFIVSLIFLGYRGKHKPLAPIPNTIRKQGKYAEPLLYTALGASIVFIFLIARLNDKHHDRLISINDQILETWIKGELERINLRQVENVSFHIMPLFHKLFYDEFHRVGKLVVLRKDSKQTFYFPVRNGHIAAEIQCLIEAMKLH